MTLRKHLARLAAAVILAIVAVAGGPALAVEPDEVLADPALEARARSLSAELRCLVCQNQSIDDSNAPLARDLRLIVRERLVAGDSDAAVRDYVVARYGKFVLLRPPLGADTVLLWAAPLVVLGGIAVWIVHHLRRRRVSAAAPSPLTAQEQARLDDILRERN